MRTLALGLVAATTLVAGCTSDRSYGVDPRYSNYSRYDHDRYDPAVGAYYADQYYVDDARYRERRLSSNDRVYRGRDGRYYCRRGDGTTGLIVGGIAGGALGAAFTSGPLGAILGAAAGAAVGNAVDRDNVRCR